MSRFNIKIVTVSSIAVLLVIAVSYFSLQRGEENTIDQTETNVSFPEGTTVSEKDKIITMIERPGTLDVGDGTYVLLGGNDTTEVSSYHLLYYVYDNSYTLIFNKTPSLEVRTQAENDLIQYLDVHEKEELCKMNISVFVPFDVDATLAGRNLGISFCKESIEVK
jgi:hypothetical protein